MNRYAAICIACAHLRFDMEKALCDAFPRGIPDEIAFGMFDHRDRFPGDHGIRFELREGFERDLERFEQSFQSVARDRRSRFYVIDGGRSD